MKRIKELFIVIGTALSAWLGILYVPAMILFACNIIDYVTGICAAGYRKENVSSYRSFRGIAKKICMWLLIAVGAMLNMRRKMWGYRLEGSILQARWRRCG